ncbi:MAG TPA: type II toxin-antitoxin system PemK/MazF family toxin [Stellaceae bacterium]|nr:type II toxin-antitoxin system PemK/MazF family toxin [Stellaceae bacterium]
MSIPPTVDPPPEARPPRVAPRIKAAPSIRQIYWCDFWTDSQLPEMWKRRPAIVVSFKNTLAGPCTVLPTSSEPQDANPWAHKLSFRPDGRTESWVICNHPITVAPSRFSQFHSVPVIPRLSVDEFDRILRLLFKWFPVPTSPAGT